MMETVLQNTVWNRGGLEDAKEIQQSDGSSRNRPRTYLILVMMIIKMNFMPLETNENQNQNT
jgi:hypothetical protein